MQSVARLKHIAALSSLAVAFLLFIGKLFVGLSVNSVAILASATDSGIDFISSIINFFAIKTAMKPADSTHRFGYGKAEALASFLQGLLILSSAGIILWESIIRILDRKVLTFDQLGIWMMVFSLVLTLSLVFFQSIVIYKTKSTIIKADRLHFVSDIGSNLAVIASLFLVNQWGLFWVDNIVAMGIVLILLFSCIGLIRQSIHDLMDYDISESYRDAVKQVILSFENKILGYHDLRTRSSGNTHFLEIHLELEGKLPLKESHLYADQFIERMGKKFPNLEITVHLDPVIQTKTGLIHYPDIPKPKFY